MACLLPSTMRMKSWETTSCGIIKETSPFSLFRTLQELTPSALTTVVTLQGIFLTQQQGRLAALCALQIPETRTKARIFAESLGNSILSSALRAAGLLRLVTWRVLGRAFQCSRPSR